MATAQVTQMDELLKASIDCRLPRVGTLVEGPILDIQKNAILVDINGFATGIIAGRETHDSFDTMKSAKVGEMISAYVIEDENDEGFTVLSLRKASQEKSWNKFIEAYENNETITVQANEANKGGLLLEVDGIKGFIPVSQLAPLNYPRVNGADANQIYQRLMKLVGRKFEVKIINIDKDNGKLILSEKAAYYDERKNALKDLKPGQVVTGRISGIVKFGIFVAFNHLEGLVHISEIAWGHVKNPADHGKLGDEVEVQVIGVEGEKISLSMKRLVPDPWAAAAKEYTVGKVVKGVVNRITPFGVFIRLNDDINGLIHVSELSDKEVKEPSEVVKVGEKIEAKIIAVDLDDHRIGLSIKALSAPAKAESKEETPAEETKKEEKTD